MSSKLLVSDYDGTFKFTPYSLSINIEAVKKFREKGNVFAISTGRNFDSIRSEIQKYNIPFDYLGCTDGSLLYDSNFTLMKKHEFQNDEVGIIDSRLKKMKVDFIKDLFKCKDVLQYYSNILKLENKEDVLEEFHNLFSDRGDFLDVDHFKFGNYAEWLLLRPRGINKTKTAYDIMSIRDDVLVEDVITIGDGDNDMTMLKEFNGYTLWTAKESVRTLCKKKIVCSVRDLIENIEE